MHSPRAFAESEYVVVYGTCLKQMNDQVVKLCTGGFGDPAFTAQECIDDSMAKSSAGNVAHCTQVANEGYSGGASANARVTAVAPPDDAGGTVEGACVAAPGVTCAATTSPRPRARPQGLGGAPPPAAPAGQASAPAGGSARSQNAQPQDTATAQSEASGDLAACGNVSVTPSAVVAIHSTA